MSPSLGKRIKALRRLKRLNQQELAGRVDISVSMLSNVERGVKKPKPELIEKIAQELNMPLEDFFILPKSKEKYSLF